MRKAHQQLHEIGNVLELEVVSTIFQSSDIVPELRRIDEIFLGQTIRPISSATVFFFHALIIFILGSPGPDSVDETAVIQSIVCLIKNASNQNLPLC